MSLILIAVLALLAMCLVFGAILGYAAVRFRVEGDPIAEQVNALLDGHIQQVEARVKALLQLKKHLVVLRERCSGAREVDACGILQGLTDCACHPISTPGLPVA